MKVKDLLEEIETDTQIGSYLSLVPKKNKKTQTDGMHVLNRLCYIFYLSDRRDLSEYLIKKMLKVPFEGNYRTWEPVQNSALLAILIDEDNYLTQVKDRNLYARDFGDEVSVSGKKKVHKRFLTGFRLNTLKKELEKTKDETSQMNKRMGILETISLLRNYMLENGFKQLYPFK